MRNATLKLVRTAVIAALYAALTLVLMPSAYGVIQFRISEALTILPLFCPEAIVGLTIGCFLANIPSGLWDMFLGALATLVAATLTRVSRKWYFGIIPPVVVNAFAVPLIIILGAGGLDTTYFACVLTVGLEQLVSVCALGIPLYFGLDKLNRRYALFGDFKSKNVSAITEVAAQTESENKKESDKEE
ncbi:MAG: QueT transporter family protein [Christensenellales bacterium]